MVDFPITIFHNPACETSRNVLGLIKSSGYEPVVVEYLSVGWTKSQLIGLLAVMGKKAHEIIREKGSPAYELGLLEEDVTEDAILDAMVTYPIVVNRPIVVTPLGTCLARPSETVMKVLDRRPVGFVKEDRSIV